MKLNESTWSIICIQYIYMFRRTSKYCEIPQHCFPWRRANPWIRAKLQLCKPVIFNYIKPLRSGQASIVVTQALQKGWSLLRAITVYWIYTIFQSVGQTWMLPLGFGQIWIPCMFFGGTGRTCMSLCCNIMVASLWCHLEHHEFGGAKKTKIHCGQRDICSWSMVNNEENWLPWQIKDWFNEKKEFPKNWSVPGTGKISSP